MLCTALQWRLFDDGCVVYAPDLAKLECLDALPAALLSLVEEGPATEAALEEAVAHAVGASAGDAAATVRTALLALQQSGLIQRSSA